MLISGGFVKFLSGCVGPMSQSLISKVASSDEIGKIFSLTVVMETIAVPLSTVLYTSVYNATVKINSSMFSYVTAGCYLILIVLSL